jgi:hypothetical protein
MKQIDIERVSGMVIFFIWNCLSGLVRLRKIRDRFEITIGDLILDETG